MYAGDANADAPHRASTCQGRDPHALERHVRRFCARHRTRSGLSVGVSTSLDAATLLNALDRYPFGCSEQIASRAMADALRQRARRGRRGLPPTAETDQRIKDAIARLLARQDSNGSFGLWSVGGDDPWLDAYVTDFLTRARERGFDVPATAYTLAIDRLRNYVATAPEPTRTAAANWPMRSTCWPATAPRRSAICAISPMSSSPMSAHRSRKAQVAAALSMLGDKERADNVYLAALDAISPQPKLDLGRADFGSALRDAAALVTLASEGGRRRRQSTMRGAARRYRARFDVRHLDPGRCLAGAGGPRARQATQRDFARRQRRAPPGRSLSQPAPPTISQPLAVDESRARAMCRRWSRSAERRSRPSRRPSSGFKIERSYYTLDGESADPPRPSRTSASSCVLKMTEPQPQFGRVIVADYLPAGFRDRQSAPGFVGGDRHARLDRRMRRAGAMRNSATTASRAAFDRKQGLVTPVFTRGLCRARRVARAATCCRRQKSRTCTGPTASAARQPARSRSRRTMSTLAAAFCGHRRGSSPRAARVSGIWVLFARTGAARQGSNIRTSCSIGRATAARLCDSEGRWRLPATRAGSRSALSRNAVRLRGQAVPRASRRRSARLGRAAQSIYRERPHRLRRLDDHHAGGASAGAARASAVWAPKMRQIVRALELERAFARTKSSRSI